MFKKLSLSKAAEIATQEVFRFYNVKLTNQKVECCYHPATEKSDASWLISIKINEDYLFDPIIINPTTGDLTSISCLGGPSIKKLSASEDEETLKNSLALARKDLSPDEACAKVKSMLTQKDFLSEPIETIKYYNSMSRTVYCVAHPYSKINHYFKVVTTSKKTYTIMTNQDLSSITSFSL